MIRVLYLSAGFKITGATESLLILASNLPADRYQVMIAATHPEILAPRLAERGIQTRAAQLFSYGPTRLRFDIETNQIRRSGFKQSAANWLATRDLIRSIPTQRRVLEPLFAEFRPDVVHINGVPLMAAGLVTHRSGIPLVWHVRETLSKNLWGRLAGFALPRIAQALVAVSKDAADHIDRSRGNVHVIHNGVDAERCRPGISGEASRAELGIPTSSPCIGFVGNMIFTKGIQDFISAAPTILELRPDAHFLLVGSGKPEFLEQLRESMVRTGCQERFHLTGQRGDVPELVAAMDVLALPSLEEGLSRAVVEAMAMEKPVVTTSIPSNREVIVTGESGLLVEPHDPPSLAAGVLRFLADGELARRCGTAARRVVLADFSIEAHVDKLDRLYDQVAKKNPQKEKSHE